MIEAADYSNPASVPVGDVLIIGSGQTGCQLAEELSDSGRIVFLSCGRNPWLPRRLGGRDFVEWLTKTAFLEATMQDLSNPLARLGGNIQATGRRGGHDLHYRTLRAQGVVLLGRFAGCEDGVAHFADDLEESVAFGDAGYGDVCGLIRKACIEKGMDVPDMPPPSPFASSAPTSFDVRRFGAVIFTSGYRPDYASWIHVAKSFDELGYPIQRDGSSTIVPGLHFMGVHFQRKRKSASLLGVAEDAPVLAERIWVERKSNRFVECRAKLLRRRRMQLALAAAVFPVARLRHLVRGPSDSRVVVARRRRSRVRRWKPENEESRMGRCAFMAL